MPRLANRGELKIEMHFVILDEALKKRGNFEIEIGKLLPGLILIPGRSIYCSTGCLTFTLFAP
jgi:hypothetical protein